MKKTYVLPIILGLLCNFFIISESMALSEDSQEYQKALATATALDEMVRSTRAYYTKMIVQKLKKEGTGAAINSDSQNGFVPLPAQFIRKIIYQIVLDKRTAGDNYTKIALRSKWNLNELQDLGTEFEKEGWEFLIKQQEKQLAAGKSLKKLDWEPYIKLDTVGDTTVLNYLSADTAVAKACSSCHSAWEQKPEIIKLRKEHNTEAGTVFKKYQLLGALSITIPLEE